MLRNNYALIWGAAIMSLASSHAFSQETDATSLDVSAEIGTAASITCEPLSFGKATVISANDFLSADGDRLQYELKGDGTVLKNSNAGPVDAFVVGGATPGECTLSIPSLSSGTKTVTVNGLNSSPSTFAFTNSRIKFGLKGYVQGITGSAGELATAGATFDADSKTTVIKIGGTLDADNQGDGVDNITGTHSTTVSLNISVPSS